jgi:uncharacterized protein (DUF983 family)
MIYRFLADFVLAFHFSFVLFIVLGGLLVLRWRSVMWVHIPALIWGFVVVVFSLTCPLTPLENWFRNLGGEAGYSGGFIEHYVSMVLYSNLSYWFHLFLGLILIGINSLVYFYVFMRRNKIA